MTALGYYYVVGQLVRSIGDGTIVVYLANGIEMPRIFAGFAHSSKVTLLLQKQVEKVDLYIHSDSILDNRIQVPVDLLEFNKQK